MFVLIALLLILYAALGAVAFTCAKRRKALFWSDAASPVLIVVLWVIITASGYGHQSLSHIIEVPVALLCALLLFNLRVFVIDRIHKRYRYNSYWSLALSLLIVVLLRTFMPYLPE